MSNKPNIIISQDFEYIPPQPQKVFGVTLREWSYIKEKINQIRDNANFYHTAGSILIGFSLSTLLTAFVNDFKDDKYLIICWAVFVVTAICGLLSFYFGYEQRKVQNKTSKDVIEQMEIIEERYQTKEKTI